VVGDTSSLRSISSGLRPWFFSQGLDQFLVHILLLDPKIPVMHSTPLLSSFFWFTIGSLMFPVIFFFLFCDKSPVFFIEIIFQAI
jgi:hypothetical protein